MAFKHFGQRFNLLLELFDNGVAMMLQLKARESGHTEPEFLGAQYDPITIDHAGRLQPLQAATDLRRRQRHFLTELLMRRAAETLKNVKQREIEVIEIDHV